MSITAFAAMAATIASAFNLSCAGKVETISLQGKTTEPYQSLYRIDLTAKKWCESDCKVPHDIASFSQVAIILHTKHVDTPRERELITNEIDRETGGHQIFVTSGTGASTLVMKYTGQCQKLPFTGFPMVETKF